MDSREGKVKRKERFGNIADYVSWRGDLSFSADHWHEADALAVAVIAYANFGENALTFGNGQPLPFSELAASDLLERLPQQGLPGSVPIRNQLITDMADSIRYRDIRILDQVSDTDRSRSIQFSAITLDIPGIGTAIGFRGTDPTLVGWKEDFMMSYMSPVPAQSAAVDYLRKAAAETEGPLILAGHSKGGNLAMYAGAHTSEDIQDRIAGIYAFDSPGLDDATIASGQYERIRPLIRSVIPSDSIVGLLMNYNPNYRVVSSTARSIAQHDPFTWKLMGHRFLEASDLSTDARIMDQTVHEWLKSCTIEQREVFVSAVFSLFDRDQEAGGTESAPSIMDENTRKMVLSLLHNFITIQAENSWIAKVRKPFLQAAEDLRAKLREELGITKPDTNQMEVTS